MDWTLIIQTVLMSYFLAHCFGYCGVVRWVTPRQKFAAMVVKGGCPCCKNAALVPRKCCWCLPRPSCSCCWMTFCPCFQCFRVLGFIYGKCCGWCGCLCFTVCCLSNPFGIIFSLVLNALCGCWISAYTRWRLRQKLGIAVRNGVFSCTFLTKCNRLPRHARVQMKCKDDIEGNRFAQGTFGGDIAMHLFATSCARCQESLEISAAGYTGCMYEHGDGLSLQQQARQLQEQEQEQQRTVTPLQPVSNTAVLSAESDAAARGVCEFEEDQDGGGVGQSAGLTEALLQQQGSSSRQDEAPMAGSHSESSQRSSTSNQEQEERPWTVEDHHRAVAAAAAAARSEAAAVAQVGTIN